MANAKKSSRKRPGRKIPAKKTLVKKARIKKDQPSNAPSYIICIGASAGGLNAVSELLSQLPADLNAAVFIVLHLSKTSLPEIFTERIKRHTPLHCTVASELQPILPSHVYLAPQDAHLLIKDDHIIIGRGPAENRFRPSIDVLFRSAAAHYGERVIGVILSGLLNDGTSGMMAIKQCGGHCIVQDPNEAEYPDMPVSVLEAIEVDHCIGLKKMGMHILDIINRNKIRGIPPPANIVAESKLSETAATAIDNMNSFNNDLSVMDCPYCGGSFWEISNGGVKHYRCHVGHSFSEKDFITKQAETIEQTLWVAVRMMEERKFMLSRIATEHRHKGLEQLSTTFRDRAQELDAHIKKLKSLLYAVSKE